MTSCWAVYAISISRSVVMARHHRREIRWAMLDRHLKLCSSDKSLKSIVRTVRPSKSSFSVIVQ